MVSIIKNQILKHLSRYVKDLSSDRINVSTLKGEGELTNLQLEEDVLTELLALPIWMKIKKAHCNRAKLMIQWTKLKSIPIRLLLDHVEIHIEACSELRPVSSSIHNAQLNVPSAGKYGFVNKVVDGITVTVESVEIRFFSQAFESKVQISRIRVESKSPQWKKEELGHTRLKDMDKGELLLFKEIEWQTLRLEAQSTTDRHLAPLRLLTNQAKARVVIKKKLIDCSVMGCRLSLILDDLLWVLTDSQILAAMHFVSSLSGLVKQATETSQSVKAARKLELIPEYRAQVHQQLQATSEKTIQSMRIYDAFDVKETSYHLVCEKIDLHFCDDAGDGRSDHPDLRDGGAGQVQLTQLMVDFYPYHLSNSNRRHWPKYATNDLTHWLKESLNTFRLQMMDVLFPKSTSGSGSSSPLDSRNIPSDRKHSSPLITTESVVSNRLNDQLSKLMSTCLILKIRDIYVYTVTTLPREVPQSFLSSYIDRPKDVSAINVECTWFYYPGSMSFPLPSPKMYTQINPLQLQLDARTILWLNSFISNLQNCMPAAPAEQQDIPYMDVRVEIIMPKIVFEEKKVSFAVKERPDGLQIQAARIVISNFRSGETGSIFQLKETLNDLEKQKASQTNSFEFPEIPQKFINHSQGRDAIRERNQFSGSDHLSLDMLWTEARDVWFICVDAVWADFCVDRNKCENDGLRSKRKFRPPTIPNQTEQALLPFVDSLPLNLWLYSEEEPLSGGLSSKKRKNIKALLRTDKIVNIQLTHQQYLFLLRALEAISEISLFLTIDTRKTYTVCRRDDSVELIGCLPRLEISFILPYPVDSDIQRENSSILGDMESTTYLEDQNIQMPTSEEWNVPTESTKPSPFDNSLFIPGSPSEPSFAQSPTNSPLPSMDSIKSSLTHGMKQGLSSLVVSFSKGGLNTPDSEVTSMWSTDSSENNFIHLESPEGELKSPIRGDDGDNVEVAEEVVEDDSQSTGSFSIHNPYAKEDNIEINILTASLDNIGLSQQSEGLRSKILLKAQAVIVNEGLHMQWNEFQTNFITRGKKWRAEVANKALNKSETVASSSSAVNVKFSQTISDTTFRDFLSSPEFQEALMQIKKTKNPRVNLIDRPGPESPIRTAINKATLPILQAIIDLKAENPLNNQFITLHNTTLKSAAEFFDDEIPPVILPLQVFIKGASIEIIEEKVSTTQSSKFSLDDGIMIKRNNDGVFNIGCPGDQRDIFPMKEKLCNGRDRAELNECDDVKDLKQTIFELRQQISTLQKDKSYLQSQLEFQQKQVHKK